MSEKVVNDINSNGSELDKNCTDEVVSGPDIVPSNAQSDNVNAENNSQTDHNLANTRELSPLKTDGQISETEKLLKTELIKIKAEYEACLERENELSTKLHKIDFQTVKVAELEILNEELREQLNESLKECGSLKQELQKYVSELCYKISDQTLNVAIKISQDCSHIVDIVVKF
jgi:predicted RNase H-like nuclease (RuvC/YqgF family)